jgi:hypothetical protein
MLLILSVLIPLLTGLAFRPPSLGAALLIGGAS